MACLVSAMLPASKMLSASTLIPSDSMQKNEQGLTAAMFHSFRPTVACRSKLLYR